MRARGLLSAIVRTASAVEAGVVRFVASLVDGASRSALAARLRLVCEAARVEAAPTRGEWAAAIAIGVLGLAAPLAAWLALDRIVLLADRAAATWTLALVMLGAAALVVAETALRSARAWLADRAALHRQAIAAGRRLAQLATAPIGGGPTGGAPSQLARLESVARLHDLQGGGLRRALLDLPCVFVGVAAIAWIGGWLALAPAALLAGAMLMLVASGADAADALRDGAAHDARSDDFFSECAAHVAVIRGAAMAPFFVRRMEQLQTSARDLQWRRIQAADRAEDLVTPLEAAMVLAVAAVGGVMALDGAVSLGALAASTLLALGVVRPVVALTAAVQRAANLWPQRAEEERLPDATTLRPATPSPAALEVDAVASPGGPRLRFSAPGGALIALTGGDGRTLSATLRVLAGIESPVDGAVFFRGVSIAACRAAHTGAVALVTPGSALLRGTILENLTLFGQGGAERDALAACDVLGLRPEIDRLPRGLETPVGEGAADALPGALAHRLCIARALALSPSLLLLDQPQARLDPAADRAMIAGLGALKGRMTVIVATNRPSYLALADRAFLVDGDRCREIAPDAPRAAARRAGRG